MLAARLAGYAGEDIDLIEAQDLAVELSRPRPGPDGKPAPGKLRPFVEWAGGMHLQAAIDHQNRAAMESMF
jgi:hypothetical protein